MLNQKANETALGLVKILFALTVIYTAFFPLRINAILYPVRIIAIIVILVLGILVYTQIKHKVDFRLFFAFFTVGIIIIGNLIAYGISITVSNMLPVISVVCFLLLISVVSKIEIDKSLIDFIYYCSVVMALIELVYSRSKYAHWNGSRVHAYLTLGIENPNMTAIILFLIYAMLIITMRGRKRIWIPVVLEVSLLWMIYLTYSRMVLVAAILLLVPMLKRKKKFIYIPMWAVKVVCILPFLFVPVYLGLYRRVPDFQILEKNFFSGRQLVFAEYFAHIDTPFSMLFGNLKGAAFQNAHNGPLAIVSSIGIVGGAAYFYILLQSTVGACKNADNPVAITAVIVVLACFVHACGEAALFLGGFPSITFVFMAFLLANTSKNAFDRIGWSETTSLEE